MNGEIVREDSHAQLFQSIGELVMMAQWVESKYRELGWFIGDPERTTWPPRSLRRETLAQMIDVVTDMFLELIQTSNFPNGGEFTKTATEVRDILRRLRVYRNQVLHSAFVELKAGGEVVGYLRTDARHGVDPDTGELVGTLENITAESVRRELATFGEACFELNMMHTQAIHWYGFDGGNSWRCRRPTP